MRNELERIKKIEAYLQGRMNDVEFKEFKEKIRTDTSLIEELEYQKTLIDRVVTLATQKAVKEAGKRFNAKANPRNRASKLGFICISLITIALVIYHFHSCNRTSTENKSVNINSESVNQNQIIEKEALIADQDTMREELISEPEVIDTTVNTRVIHSEIEKSKILPPITIDMVEIEGGLFEINKDYALNVETFELSKYEVTQVQWKYVMGENPSYFQDCDQCPVENVSWDDIQVFLARLNKRNKSNYRLPAHPEWSFAVRGGIKRKGLMYFKDRPNIKNMAWCEENSSYRTHEVGLKPPNELGIYDINGNVWEWVEDVWPDDYDLNIRSTHRRSKDKSDKILLGGSYGTSSKDFYLVWYLPEFTQPNDASPNLGFRLARSIE